MPAAEILPFGNWRNRVACATRAVTCNSDRVDMFLARMVLYRALPCQ
jgi:hypothetical protein